MSPLKVAVVGAGIGSQHIKAYQNLPDCFELVALCDLDPVKASQVARELNVKEVVHDDSTLLAKPFSRSQLLAKVQQALRSGEGSSDALN